MKQSGFAMILALAFTMLLSALVLALAYFLSYETRGVGFQLDDTKALYLAQAGTERAIREIRDDVLATTQTGTADLRGADTSGSVSVGNLSRIRYIDEDSALGGCATINSNSDIAQLRTFDSNYTQTRIISVFLFARASRATGGSGATLEVSYTTDGNFPQPGNAVLTQALPNTTALNNYFVDITADRIWTWPAIMSTDFILRAVRSSGNRSIYLDAIWLRITYAIDTNTESWFTGTYDTFPKALGDGFIQSVSIVDEARKVHLNYASQPLLMYLMREHGVSNRIATTLSNNIISYRGAALTNSFDSIEELQQVDAMTQSVYDSIKDDVTVYSFINPYSYRPPAATVTAPRAPVNINTASIEVLRAIFDPVIGTSRSAQLADDIDAQRRAAPFRCFYDSAAGPTDYTVFYNFMLDTSGGRLSYLTTARRRQILDNADASSLVPVAGYSGYNAVTTEFCYANTTYKIEAVGRIAIPEDGTGGVGLRVKTIFGNDGSRTFPTHIGDTLLTGYWKENYE